MRVLHIVPQVPPAVCGVGDYSWNIATGLKRWHGVESTFITAGVKSVAAAESSEFLVLRANDCRASLLALLIAEAPKHDAVVVQLSGYGFAKRGTPMALALTLRKFARSAQAKPIVTMFHELWATGPVRSSAFWLYPFCKLSMRLMARTSTKVRTSREGWASWLSGQRGVKDDAIACPIYSSLGEMDSFLNYGQRGEQLLLFQPLDAAQPEGLRYWSAVESTVRNLSPKGLVTAGRVKSLPAGLALEQRGYVTAEEASTLMRQTRVGMLGYYNGYLAKSSLLGAYAAHGIATVMPEINHSEADGLVHGEHFVTPELLMAWQQEQALSMADRRLEQIGHNLFNWYQGHSLRTTVASYFLQIANACADTNVFLHAR